MGTSYPLGSMLLSSTDPDRLAQWYTRIFDVEPENGMFRFGEMNIVFQPRDDIAGTNPEPGRFILNFHVDDATAAAKELDERGVSWVSPLEKRDYGYFGTLSDPDGNYLQIIELHE